MSSDEGTKFHLLKIFNELKNLWLKINVAKPQLKIYKNASSRIILT